jgi:UDP-N-acetylglucosamine 4,6-dehydratase/5-epimerase
MIPMDEARNAVEFDDYYVIKPQFNFFQRRFNKQDRARAVPDGFEYNSGTNPWRLTP